MDIAKFFRQIRSMCDDKNSFKKNTMFEEG